MDTKIFATEIYVLKLENWEDGISILFKKKKFSMGIKFRLFRGGNCPRNLIPRKFVPLEMYLIGHRIFLPSMSPYSFITYFSPITCAGNRFSGTKYAEQVNMTCLIHQYS